MTLYNECAKAVHMTRSVLASIRTWLAIVVGKTWRNKAFVKVAHCCLILCDMVYLAFWVYFLLTDYINVHDWRVSCM